MLVKNTKKILVKNSQENYFKWNKLQTNFYFSKVHNKNQISKSEKEGHIKIRRQNNNERTLLNDSSSA